MASSGRRHAREGDPILKNVKRASRELDDIVAGIIQKGSKMGQAIRDRDSSAESAESVESTRHETRDDNEPRRKEGEERRVVRLRFASSTCDANNNIRYVVSKRKATFHANMDEVRLRSDPNKGSDTILKLKVSRSEDPDWTHMTIILMDPNDRLMATVDLECRGEEARAIRINGLPAEPANW